MGNSSRVTALLHEARGWSFPSTPARKILIHVVKYVAPFSTLSEYDITAKKLNTL